MCEPYLAGHRVDELAKGRPGRDFELHDVDADVVSWGTEIASPKRHRDDTLVVGDVEPERGIDLGGRLCSVDEGVRGLEERGRTE